MAILAGGCFWTVEAVFSHVRGVKAVEDGYHGGTTRQARYELVTSGLTDHAEAVRIVYDPAVVRYDQLLRIHMGTAHDPAQMGGQGPDRGSEYRSAIIPVTPHQARIAGAYLAQLAEMKPTTRIEPYRAFYPAENAHQDFARRHPQHPYPRVGRAAYRRARPALSAALQRWLDRALSGAIWVS